MSYKVRILQLENRVAVAWLNDVKTLLEKLGLQMNNLEYYKDIVAAANNEAEETNNDDLVNEDLF